MRSRDIRSQERADSFLIYFYMKLFHQSKKKDQREYFGFRWCHPPYLGTSDEFGSPDPSSLCDRSRNTGLGSRSGCRLRCRFDAVGSSFIRSIAQLRTWRSSLAIQLVDPVCSSECFFNCLILTSSGRNPLSICTFTDLWKSIEKVNRFFADCSPKNSKEIDDYLLDLAEIFDATGIYTNIHTLDKTQTWRMKRKEAVCYCYRLGRQTKWNSDRLSYRDWCRICWIDANCGSSAAVNCGTKRKPDDYSFHHYYYCPTEITTIDDYYYCCCCCCCCCPVDDRRTFSLD
jgi:hypothetical protein